MNDDVTETILSVFETSLEAQLRAVRRLQQPQPAAGEARRRKGLSQVEIGRARAKGCTIAIRLTC